MAQKSKAYKAAAAKIDADKSYTAAEAVALARRRGEAEQGGEQGEEEGHEPRSAVLRGAGSSKNTLFRRR